MAIPVPPELNILRAISARMGTTPTLIQASGGNTSYKDLDTNILWVKASGTSLSQALDQTIFLPLDLTQVRTALQSSSGLGASFQVLSDSPLRPSIETSLHAVMPHPAVLHSHAIDAIALTLLTVGKALMAERLHDIDWHWIPYCRPGEPLTRAIQTALERHPADVLILANHGLVVGADTPDAAERLQTEIVGRLRLTPRTCFTADVSRLHTLAQAIPGASLPRHAVTHTLATDPWSLALAQQNPAYPDHVVFCGVRPVVVDAEADWAEAVEAIASDGRQAIPYILVPQMGVILLKSASPATEAMLRAQAEVFLRVPVGQTVHFLSDEQCDELVNWDAEKYRKARERTAS